ncbi:MAPEG family protein [Prochlorothrix hollandica]|uniref:Membrane protein n=1 Tax=Prochlorothrix hollandica PCC 9006 = CALU 1027 TaxID=317619 RepID=A0A0M2PZW0_PROHO|nr:MAPEG family protein [Prochlorothrix hollandica]KKJ00234.1 membrane protein [Prochlorothrix hollandica PCC 9006 = CALU 1027]
MTLSPWPSLVTIAALILYLYTLLSVGRARFKYSVPPPAMSGNPDFDRVMRVQVNTLEQLVLFLPVLWLFSFYVSPTWGSGIGALWVIGRAFYAWGYIQEASKRTPGFGISFLSTFVLLIGSLVGILRTFF